MRKILAAVALTGAAFGINTQPASADGCYGVDRYATACYYGGLGTNPSTRTFCVYTGGTTCKTVEVPLVTVETPYMYEVCVVRICTPV